MNKCKYLYRNIHNAICFNDSNAVKYMCENGYKYGSIDMDYAASLGYIKIMQILHINGIHYTNSTMNSAICNFQIYVMMYLYSINKHFDDRSLELITQKLIYINNIQYIQNKTIIIMVNTLYNAGLRCTENTIINIYSIELFKLVCRENNNYTESVMDKIAELGHMNKIMYLHSIGNKCTTNAIDLAAGNGHLNVIVYLHTIGKDCTTNAMDNAASNGHLEVVVYLHDIGKSFTSKAITNAETNGHKDVVKYLRSIS